MSTRRFTEDEIARIFEEAAKNQANPDLEEGLSLEELQSIGEASGLSPEAIAQAAKKFNYSFKLGERRTLLFNDVGVSAVADLPGRLSHADWHELLGEIRSTFAAAGKVSSESGGRIWRNGNLSVIVEEGKLRDRLRMSTKRAGRINFLQTGLAVVASLSFIMGFEALFGDGTWNTLFFLVMSLGAAMMIGLSRVRQKRWADLRESQFHDLAESASRLVVSHDDEKKQLEGLDIEEVVSGFGDQVSPTNRNGTSKEGLR